MRAASASLAHGANVLVNKGGALIAYNTDGQGCVAYLEGAGVSFAGKSVVVCGTGPTALSILHAVAQAGPADVLLLGRDKERAHRVMRTYADELGAMIGRTVDMPAFKEGHLSFAEVYKRVDFRFGSYDTSRQAIARCGYDSRTGRARLWPDRQSCRPNPTAHGRVGAPTDRTPRHRP